ncbi:MAG: tetratricopeptide repeat protein [Acetobacteraceae bacterium]
MRAYAAMQSEALLLEECRGAPEQPSHWRALGQARAAAGDWPGALGAYAEAERLAPDDLSLALARGEMARRAGAGEAECARLALLVAANPLDVVSLAAQGVLLGALGREEEGIDTLKAASVLAPANAEVAALLGRRLVAAERLDEADTELRRAIALGHPDEAELRNILGAVLMRRYRHAEAYAVLAALLADRGEDVVPLCNLASAAASLGRQDEAAAILARAERIAPGHTLPSRILCNTLPYRHGIGGAELLAAGQAHAARLPRGPLVTFPNARDPARRLRVGLLSGSLRVHPVGWLTVAGFEALDPSEFTLVGLTQRTSRDWIAGRFRAAAAEWHEVGRLGDAQLAARIRELAIDIVIDLGGYGDAGRLPALARRAAPVQVKWVGMQSASTGLAEIDWFLTDRWQTPDGFERFYSERLLRLADGYVCYSPPPYAPEVAELPALRSGTITFGCLNNLAKITPSVISAWSRILAKIGGSRLLLKTHQLDEPMAREQVMAAFVTHGIGAERLVLAGASPHRAFLSEYNRVDLQLDPFPYSGGLTTCEALWMGVATVTLPGETFASRHSLSHLSNVGLTDWVARDLADYERLAVAKATDVAGLAHLRRGLRARVAASPLCDAPRFGRSLDAALRLAWCDWCESEARVQPRNGD